MAGLGWCNSAANPRVRRATAGDRMTAAFGWITAAGPISKSNKGEVTEIGIGTTTATVIATTTVTDIAETTTGPAGGRSSPARRMTCTGTIAPPTHAAEYAWSSRTASRLAGKAVAGDMIVAASGSTTAAEPTSRLAGRCPFSDC